MIDLFSICAPQRILDQRQYLMNISCDGAVGAALCNSVFSGIVGDVRAEVGHLGPDVHNARALIPFLVIFHTLTREMCIQNMSWTPAI